MRTQAERDEQTLDIVTTFVVGTVLLGVPALAALMFLTALDLGDRAWGAVFAVLFGGYVAFVLLRLSRMSPWSASSSRASARPSTPTPSSRRPRP